jgi:hypothetical protein
VGTPGQTFFVIGVYGFKYAAWLVFATCLVVEHVVFIIQPVFFLFFYFLVLLQRSQI